MRWLSTREITWLIGKSILAVCSLNYFFYRSAFAILPLSVLGFLYYQAERNMLIHKKKGMAKEQFKELLLLVSTGQKAGYSVENALLTGYHDMRNLYGESSIICRMLTALRAGGENNIPLSRLFGEIGESIGIQEIQDFAQIFEISYKSSGNMSAVMEKTAELIVQKLETEKEIEVMLSARKLEQRIMNVMPFLIMLYINLTSPGYFGSLYQTAAGAGIMSICLLIYLGAYALSQKLTAIEI